MPKRGPARCRGCGAPVVFFRSPFTTKLRTFNPTPFDGHTPNLANAYPVEGRSAYRPLHLAEQIQVRDHISDVEAMSEVRNMQWFQLHTCPPTPEGTPA